MGTGASVDGGPIQFTCCDVWGNAGGDWVGPIAGQYGIDGNIREDPRFCVPEDGDFRLLEDSPCAPGTECDRIGAWPVGCGASSVADGPDGAPPATTSSWGELKALYR